MSLRHSPRLFPEGNLVYLYICWCLHETGRMFRFRPGFEPSFEITPAEVHPSPRCSLPVPRLARPCRPCLGWPRCALVVSQGRVLVLLFGRNICSDFKFLRGHTAVHQFEIIHSKCRVAQTIDSDSSWLEGRCFEPPLPSIIFFFFLYQDLFFLRYDRPTCWAFFRGGLSQL